MCSSARTEVAIVGGGIIGLACAWHLINAGLNVTVIDAAGEARAASWAAAGMLAPHHEVDPNSHTTGTQVGWRFGCASLALWPRFAAELGVTAEFNGGIIPALNRADRDLGEQRRDWLEQHGVAVTALTAAQLATHEPAVAPTLGGWLLPGGRVDPRACVTALSERIIRGGGRILQGRGVRAITADGVELADGSLLGAAITVIASGAWTPGLAALCGIDLPGEPVKGQMLRFAVDERRLRHFIHCHHAYVVPRHHAGIVVGSTMVRAGFDLDDDPAAIAQLAAGARRLCPALAAVPIAEYWTGLRPRLHSGLPVIDRPRPHLVIATGHFRNGILLAPVTAQAVAGLVTAHAVAGLDLTAFSLARSAKASPP